MREWLPHDWKDDAIDLSAHRALGAVVRRVARRRRIIRTARWTGVAVVLVAAVFFLAPRLDHQTPPGHSMQVAQRAPAQSPSPEPENSLHKRSAAKSVDVQVSKADHGVTVTWQGNPEQEYVVYRCTSPRFDACSTVGVVKGDRWVDTAPIAAPLVFYKVEARKGA